jgi:biopolymer transport protein TolR
MAMTIGGRGGASAEMNVTPMIDVLLVMIIVFMLLPHSMGETAEIPQKSDDPHAPVPEKTIVIQIREAAPHEQPTLKINQQDVSWQNLEARLQEIFNTRMEKVAFVKGDPDIDFQYVADIVDVAHHVGVMQVGLLGTND